MSDIIDHIINIGKGTLKPILHDFLPSYPVLHGSEAIFQIGWENSKQFINTDIEYLIKGLHLIELEYMAITKHDFGFGSPSPTFKLIEALIEEDYVLAHKLFDWIAKNKGNYYIPRRKLLSRSERQEIQCSERTRNHEYAKIKKEAIQSRHRKVMLNQKRNTTERTDILDLSLEQLIDKISIDNVKPIHYYEEAIMNISKEEVARASKNRLIKFLEEKYQEDYPKKTVQIVNQITGTR